MAANSVLKEMWTTRSSPLGVRGSINCSFSSFRSFMFTFSSSMLKVPIKMVDEDEIFRKFRRKTPEWMADLKKPCFSLELEIFKSTTNDGEPAPAVETSSTSEITFSA